MLFVQFLFPFLLLHCEPLTSEYPSADSTLAQILASENVWTLLVTGYHLAPSNMIIAATCNVDLSKDCPEDESDRTIYLTEDIYTNAIPGLKCRGYVILKDGSVESISIGQEQRESCTARSWTKVYWPSGSVYGNNLFTNLTWKYVCP